MAEGVFTPYSTVRGFVAALPGWVPDIDKERIASYQTYEEIYWNHPETFKLVVRGTEEKPIYIPSGRTIVETVNRYVGKDLNFAPDPALGSDTEKTNLKTAFSSLFRRERFFSKYNSAKRYGLIQGDWLFHVHADDTKPEGTRISIDTVDPAAYFPVTDPNDPDRIVKVHLAEQFLLDSGETVVKRQTYEYLDNGQIQTSLGLFKVDEWFNSNGQPTEWVIQPKILPDAITHIPVYHIPNFDQPGGMFGSSEMRGLETLMAAINQSISDEDLALAMAGLGVYAVDNASDEEWVIGPARVVENASNFRRVEGISNVTPYGDHVRMVKQFMHEASGTPEAAIGSIDVSTAESGVALVMKLGPILSKADEKDQIIRDVLTQMFFDLATMWFPTYERQSFGAAVPIPTFGDRLPKNRKATIEEVVAMMSTDPPLISPQTGRAMLAKVGIEIADDEDALVAAVVAARQSADPFGDRMSAEAGDGGAA